MGIKCWTVSQTSCVTLLKNVIVIDDKNIMCCSDSDNEEVESDLIYGFAKYNVETSHETLKVQIKFLKELIKN